MSGVLQECFKIEIAHRSGKHAGQPIVPVIDEMNTMAGVNVEFQPEKEIDVDEQAWCINQATLNRNEDELFPLLFYHHFSLDNENLVN